MTETYSVEDDGSMDGILHGYCDRKFRDILRQHVEHGGFVGDAIGCPECFLESMEGDGG